jgi:hypothetical protein
LILVITGPFTIQLTCESSNFDVFLFLYRQAILVCTNLWIVSFIGHFLWSEALASADAGMADPFVSQANSLEKTV